jgi:hypothetical protein
MKKQRKQYTLEDVWRLVQGDVEHYNNVRLNSARVAGEGDNFRVADNSFPIRLTRFQSRCHPGFQPQSAGST